MKKPLKDTDISAIFNISVNTIRDWKVKEKTNWRYKIYTLIKNMSKDEINLILNRSKRIGDIK